MHSICLLPELKDIVVKKGNPVATFFLLLEEEVIPLQAKAQSESSIAYRE